MKKFIIKVIKEIKDGFNLGFKKTTGYGVDIIFDNDFVNRNNCIFAVCIRYTDDSHKIFVDNEFMAMPEKYRSFVIWHELGHIGNDNNGIRTLECECKADAYAASKIGKINAVKALNYMWTRLGVINISACTDIPSRLKALGANVDSMYIKLKDGTILKEPDLRKLIQ